MEIEVWADVVCPWCYIGKKKLEQALAAYGAPVTVVHRAFQLDPTTPLDETRLVQDVLAEKYRRTAAGVAQMMEQVTEAAREVGLRYELGKTRAGNTLLAHRFLKFAETKGVAAVAWEAVYRAYFCEAQPVFAVSDLCRIAVSIGLDSAEVERVLASEAFTAQVQDDLDTARAIGVTGVPFFVRERRLAVSGAQPPAVLLRMLNG